MNNIIAHAIRLTQELISVPSESSEPTQTKGPCEAGVVKVLQRLCSANNISGREQEVYPKRSNFIASFPRPSAPKILIVAHMDTISGKGMNNPFQAWFGFKKLWQEYVN